MAIRRLVRLGVTADQGGTITQPEHWTTEATETYSVGSPGASPVSWGTDPEKAELDRNFDATGSLKQHLGALLTFTPSPPDLAFYGAQIKVQPTFAPTETPFLDIWTHDTSAGWTRQRHVDVTKLCRSGETIIVDLLFNAITTTRLDKVWITLAPSGSETLNWLALHLFGDCVFNPGTPDCPIGSDPPDCSIDCSAFFDAWTCDPNDGDPPAWTGLPPIPTPGTPGPFNFPPITAAVPMPTTYRHTVDGWEHDCPYPTQIVMFFDIKNTNAQVTVGPINSPVGFLEGTTQTINATGEMTWTVVTGFTPFGTNVQALPPRELLESIVFAFHPRSGDPLALLDFEQFLFASEIAYVGTCITEPPQTTDFAPVAPDAPPDDAAQTTYQRVYERWLVYTDTDDHATAAIAAETFRLNEYNLGVAPLPYGLRIDDANLLHDALTKVTSYLSPTFDPLSCNSADTTGVPLDFNQLADGHVISLRVYVVPVEDLLSHKNQNPFENARKMMPFNPTPNVQSVTCPPGSSGADTQNVDLAQKMRVFRNFTLTPQITKYGGAAVQPTGYHLARGVTENEAFDTIGVNIYPSPDNDFMQTWDPPCTTPLSGRCYQWFGKGFAYLITIRVYEPTATPIGAAVEVEPPFTNPTTWSTRFQAGGVLELDGRWP